MKVSVISSKLFTNEKKVKDFLWYLSERNEEIIIAGTGESYGASKYAKDAALFFKFKYCEYNAAHTLHNEYSIMAEGYYGQRYDVRNFYRSQANMIKDSDVLVVFNDKNIREKVELKRLNGLIKYAKKYGVKVLVIK